MRCTVSRRSEFSGTDFLRAPGERVLQRAEHQRERRTEFVTDIAEECGLGAVDFRQRFSPLALLLESLCVGNALGNLTGKDVEEAAVIFVKALASAHASHHYAERLCLADLHEWDEKHLAWLLIPRPTGQVQSEFVGISQFNRTPRANGVRHFLGADRVRALDVQPAWNKRMLAINAGEGDGFGVLPFTVETIERGELYVVGVLAKHVGDDLPCLRLAAGVSASRSQVTQSTQASLADDLLGGLRNRGEDARNLTSFIQDRTVGKRVVRLLGIAVPLDEEQQVIGPGSLAGAHHVLEHGPNDVPDLGPDYASRLPQRPRMLTLQGLAIGVVVQDYEFRPPPEK